MVYVGIDVAKDKHGCFILSLEGEILADVFTISSSRAGFEAFLQRIQFCTQKTDKI
jgi:predicted NBD/HSP70 family sugar kinase